SRGVTSPSGPPSPPTPSPTLVPSTLATSSLSVASHSITAVYAGDGNFATSTSNTVNQSVGQAATSTTLSSSANPSVFGQSVTFTATVAPVRPGAAVPTRTRTSTAR